MEDEQFVSGFCKAQNQTRMVLCVIETGSDNKAEIVETDCAYGVCSHTNDCLLMKSALETLA